MINSFLRLKHSQITKEIIIIRHARLLHQFIVFASIGALATTIQYLILIFLVEWFNINPVISSTIGFILSACVNYILSYIVVFKSTKKHTETFIKFMAVASIGLLLNLIIMYFGTYILQWQYLVSQVSATIIVLFWNFTINKVWTFSHRENINNGN